MNIRQDTNPSPVCVSDAAAALVPHRHIVLVHSFVYSCAVKRSGFRRESVPRLCSLGSRSLLGFALGLVGLLAEVGLDLLAEHQHAQVGVRRLVHGFGLDAHAVLLRRQLVGTLLLVPQVEEAGDGRAGDNQVAPKVLPVQVDVLHAPALDVQVEPTWHKNNIRVHLKRLMV